MRNLRVTLIVIGVFQVFFGVVFLVATGVLTLAQVTTAAVAPPLFIAALLVLHPRRRGSAARTQARAS